MITVLGFEKFEKFLIKLFSKSFRSQGRAALVACRNTRNKSSAFLLGRVFFAPPLCKEKPAIKFTLTNNLFVYENSLAAFSFDEIGAKEKAIKKKSAEYGGRCPSTPQTFEKV